MRFWGLNVVDLAVVASYVIGMMAIGKWLSKKIKGESDFYLAGRKLGKIFQFFLNFGNMTDANNAGATASVVYKQGAGGIWIALQTLFMTPYYWFMNLWFRRVRLITMADLFTERFGGRFLGGYYAVFNLIFAMALVGWGYMIACKTMQAIMVKPEAAYTQQEKETVEKYEEYRELQDKYVAGDLTEEEMPRYQTLKDLYNKGEISSYISYVNPIIFYAIYAVVVGVYIVLGGFSAAAVTDAVQGLLIIIFSIILVPIGLFKLGGFAGLHDSVPDYMFRMFGGDIGSEYTWYSILAVLFTSWVQIHGLNANMAIGGSATNEFSARLGAVTGGFAKRFMIIAWALCALIAVGLFSDQISDPDMTWGVLTRHLLPPGLIGLMLAGILAANMSTLDAQSLVLSALFVRNLYAPIAPGKSERHYVVMGRFAVIAVLVAGVVIALYVSGVVSLLKSIIAMNVTFGAPTLLVFIWRRLTKKAVIIQVLTTTVLIVLIPYIAPLIPSVNQSKQLTVRTEEQTTQVTVPARESDVRDGLAEQTGEQITKTRVIEPVSVYFEKVTRVDPLDPESPRKGVGRFKVEVYIMGKLGMDVKSLSPAGLMAVRFLFDGIFPFIILFLVSPLTARTDKRRLDRFYVKMKTPVAATPQRDEIELKKSYDNPARFNDSKLFPNSDWEMGKWDKTDTIGFVLCWVAVAVILCVLWTVLNIGS